MAAPIPIDLSKAQPVDDWKADPDPARIKITINDGGKTVVLSLELNVVNVSRVGNNPQTGEPLYNIGSTNIVKTLKWDRSLKATPAARPPSEAYR